MCDKFMTKTKPDDPRYKIDANRSVEVYRNLHRNCYSIKQDGLVKAHATTLKLNDCTFHVNEKSRNRIRKTRKKEVHAWVKGKLQPLTLDRMSKMTKDWFNRIYYNPMHDDGFVTRTETSPIGATFCQIIKTNSVNFTPDGIFKSKENILC